MAEHHNHHDLPESHLKVMAGVDAGREEFVPQVKKRKRLSVDDYVKGVVEGNRAIIGRTFSLVESANPSHRTLATEVLEKLLPHSGKSIRIGITGSPGVGKSTFIEAMGMHLIGLGHRVAVLTVDPSSEISGGSILGDKTRMEELARHPNAFIRPSACGKVLGGVARGTRESMIVSEAAGFNITIVETVGVGQSETQVASMVDFFLFLALAGAGDELQGIKRGILEMVDTIAITKADGDNRERALAARANYTGALRLFRPSVVDWAPRVLACSAITGRGIKEIWDVIMEHRAVLEKSGGLEKKRRAQEISWMQQMIEQEVITRFYRRDGLRERLDSLKKSVAEGTIGASAAAEKLLSEFGYSKPPDLGK